jgi:hypothetical protein
MIDLADVKKRQEIRKRFAGLPSLDADTEALSNFAEMDIDFLLAEIERLMERIRRMES